jgi:hypothetical protein
MWEAVNTNAWIQLMSGGSGVGSGGVAYSVSANISPAARTGTVSIAGAPFTVVQDSDPLTMDTVPIGSPAARALLGIDTLPLRSIRTEYVPAGPVPVLRLEDVTDAVCRQRLLRAVELNFLERVTDEQVGALHDAEMVVDEQSACWVHRASGSYSFTRLQNSMAIPTRFADYHEAIQVALDYVANHQLIERVDGELVDLIAVSAVENALTQADVPDTPLERFRSDYYVMFGRRFRGVPVIGSELVVRLGGNGEVAMVRRNWRRIVEVGAELMTVSTNSVAALIARDARVQARDNQPPVTPLAISIVSMKCGYIEAPVSYRQLELRLGGVFRFAVGANRSAAEDLSQLTLPLEDGRPMRQLWGRGYPLCILTFQEYGPDGCRLLVESSSGSDYTIQASDNLSDWRAIGTVANVNGTASFVDRQTGQQRRFYRAVELP